MNIRCAFRQGLELNYLQKYICIEVYIMSRACASLILIILLPFAFLQGIGKDTHAPKIYGQVMSVSVVNKYVVLPDNCSHHFTPLSSVVFVSGGEDEEDENGHRAQRLTFIQELNISRVQVFQLINTSSLLYSNRLGRYLLFCSLKYHC